MNHVSPLIQDLSIILITAAVTSLIFSKLKQPVILGYMLAGLLVGPNVEFFPSLSDRANINVWAEMGVIFMLFSLGLDFSFRKLAQMGSVIFAAGLFEMAGMFTVTYLVARYLLDWSALQSLFLGCMLSISSTTIIFKSFDEFGLKTKKFAQLVFGILVVEDLIAILMIVLLTTVGLTQQFQGTELLLTSGKLAFYLIWWFVIGLFLVPWSLRTIGSLLSEEIALIVAMALCFMMVVAASQAGFSPALGAFIMGSILGETDEKEKIEKIMRPIRNLFSAVFFVSVGMLLSPQSMIDQYQIILCLAALVIFGKIYFVTTSALVAGQTVQMAIPAGISMAQIGEFSFIIATLGLSLKITDDKLYSVIVSVSLVTTFITPILIRSRERLSNRIERLIPKRAQFFLHRYTQFSTFIKASPEWQGLLKSYVAKFIINIVLVTAIFILSKRLLLPLLTQSRVESPELLSVVLTILLSSPFLWGIAFSHSRDPKLLELLNRQFSRRLQKTFVVFRLGLTTLLMAIHLIFYLSLPFLTMAGLLTLTIVFLALAPWVGSIYEWFESRLLSQFDRTISHAETPMPVLAPWDAHLSDYEVPPEASYVGKSLESLALRETFGIIIAMIQRGRRLIPAPSRHEILMPYDRLSVIGTDEQLEQFEDFLKNFQIPGKAHPENYILHQYLVTDISPFRHQSIRNSGIREKSAGLVVGLERDGQRILNPHSDLEIRTGDLLWIVGDIERLKSL